MTAFSSSRAVWLSLIVLATVVRFALPAPIQAQSSSDPGSSSDDAGNGHILLVLPFDNLANPDATNPASTASGATASPSNLDWIREAAPVILDSRLTSAGFLPLSREDRLYALDHLGLPESFQPSRATALRIAGTLDADSIIFGNFSTKGTTLTFNARIVDVSKLRLSQEITESGEISQILPLLDSLAWKLTRKLDPSFGVAEETFRAADANLRLDAFEQYIRGLTEHDTTECLRHLKKATDLSPNFTEAWLTTGKVQFASQQYEQAAISFGKVTRPANGSDPAALEAGFYRGLSLLFSGGYPKAEESFAAVARVLPLPEVVNNEAIAISRRGHDAISLFRQAVAADPTDADYHFNLAVSLHRHGDKAEALTELALSLKLRPGDSEAKALNVAWTVPATAEKPQTDTASTEPLERIKRSYNGAAFRQAALMLDQVEATRLQALSGAERAARLSRTAREKLDRGLLLEAEREYQAALAADDHSAEAHAGVAQVRERAGDPDAARKEAHAALDRQPNADAYLVLARLDLTANHLTEAHEEATEAVHLDNTSHVARDLRKAIEAKMDAAAKPAYTPGSASNPAAKPE